MILMHKYDFGFLSAIFASNIFWCMRFVDLDVHSDYNNSNCPSQNTLHDGFWSIFYTNRTAALPQGPQLQRLISEECPFRRLPWLLLLYPYFELDCDWIQFEVLYLVKITSKLIFIDSLTQEHSADWKAENKSQYTETHKRLVLFNQS